MRAWTRAATFTTLAVVAAADVRGEGAELNIPRITTAPAMDDFRGRTQPSAVAAAMARVDVFVQRAPDDGQPATQWTEVYFGYTTRNLYVVFVAHDTEPQKIRARLGRREAFPLDEDQVGIYIDTFHDKRRAYQFACNAVGVQSDSIFTDDSGTWDESFDTVWDSQGVLTDDGYIVWMSIPFRSLRFSHDAAQQWGIAVWRWLPRRAEGSWWPRVSQSVRGFLSQEATAKGLERISPGRNMQFIPYVDWRTFRVADVNVPDRPPFVDRLADVKAGGDAKLVVKDSLVLDLTGNPDFAQVESDEPQITINQRFEVYFPERRPFFTENGTYFDVPMAAGNKLLFTRRIADPGFGARLTGKVNRFAIGALVADDRAPARRAVVDVFRISRDFATQSNVGATFTERRLGNTFNRVVSADGTWRAGRTWSVTAFGANSWTGDGHGTIRSRSDSEARIDRQGRGFNYDLQFVDMAPDFDVQSGYIFRTDNRYVTQDASYTFWRTSGITKVKPRLYVEKGWFYHGGSSYNTVAPSLSLELNRQTTIELYTLQWNDILRPKDYSALFENESFREMTYGASGTSSQWRSVRLDFKIEGGRRLHYIPPRGLPPVLADYERARLGATVRPAAGVSIDHTYLFDRNRDRATGARMYSSHVLRSKWTWQVTRELSFRFIGQYNALVADPRFTATPTSRSINADVLFTYLVHPGTALYVGYNSNRVNPAPFIGPPPTGGFVEDARQFFVKASYLFRF